MKKTFVTILSLLCFVTYMYAQGEALVDKCRMVVLTDIGNEPDDSQTMVRLMLYSNQIDIEGLIATTSIHRQKDIGVDMIKKIVTAYGKVQPNLLLHEKGFPTGQEMMDKVKAGCDVYGMTGVGKGKQSEGSEWIIKMIDKNDPRPLWITAWGGTNTLAQALWELRETRSKAEMDRIIKKLRVYAISDQDDAGFWIRETFKDLFYIVSPCPYQKATWCAWTAPAKGEHETVNSNEWIEKNIQQGHGPLGACYPDVSYGNEGDTPSWLGLIPNGMNDYEHPNWGGWGGRYELYTPTFNPNDKWIFPLKPETRPIWTNAEDEYTPFVHSSFGAELKPDTIKIKDNFVTLWRWREAIQNDFAARMNWCNTKYGEANHAPVVVLNNPDRMTVKSGRKFRVDASPSYDPDGDALSFLWILYKEAGTNKADYKPGSFPNTAFMPNVQAPKVSKPETMHLIVCVTDKGTPRLTRYKRVIVTVVP